MRSHLSYTDANAESFASKIQNPTMTSYNAYAGTFIALLAGLGSTTILAVVLRLVARRKAGVSFGLEDACAIFALLANIVFLSTAVWGECVFYPTSIRN